MKFPIKDVKLFASVVIDKERVTFSTTDYGESVCALIPIEDYQVLEGLTDLEEGREALKILDENSPTDLIAWNVFEKEIHDARI